MEIFIKKVQFLVPVIIVFTLDDVEKVVNGQIDYVNKQLYLDNHQEIKEKVFEYLKISTTLPEDGFAITSSEIMDIDEELKACQNLQT